MTLHPHQQAFLAEIEAFLEAHGMSPGSFGKRVFNDVHFVPRLREGANITIRTIARGQAFIAAHQQADADAA